MGHSAYVKNIIEDTTHTAHETPKKLSFSNNPPMKQSTSQRKIRVYSNPIPPSASQELNSKVIDWLNVKITLERDS